MKYIYTVLLALFPFLHNERYTITLQSCKVDRIVFVYENERFEASLFNMKIKEEEGWTKTCAILENANHIEMEIDASSAIQEPLPVYVFVDGELLQERLVREDDGYTLIHNPEYIYERKLMEIEDSKEVVATTSKDEEYPYPAQGWMFLLFIFICWLSMLLYSLYKKKKISSKKH